MNVDEPFSLVICRKWESFPREFAKCRRCRKAKYCGKECQSTAWGEGHRFWCSAKDMEEDLMLWVLVMGILLLWLRLSVLGQVQVQQQDHGDHGDLPGIHIAVEGMGMILS
jgi:hypothetical protein